MQKKQFQQNMKDKVRVFEDGGIRLLKRGQKGVVHAIFSRFGLVLVLLLLQAFALFSLLQWFGELLPHYFGGTLLVTAAMMVYLLNQDMDNSVRITWLVVTALMPVLGVPLFWYTKSDVGHNALKRRLLDLEGQTRAQLPQNEQTVELLRSRHPKQCRWHGICGAREADFRSMPTRWPPTSTAAKLCSMKCCASWKRQKNTSFWNISSWMKA
ncbi:MAG: PLD nuclease N-terminal domain-containing protein [Faecalibacterium sp.]